MSNVWEENQILFVVETESLRFASYISCKTCSSLQFHLLHETKNRGDFKNVLIKKSYSVRKSIQPEIHLKEKLLFY